MKKFIIATTILLVSASAYAMCTTQTFDMGGKITTCTTCCYEGQCHTTCF